MVPCGGEREGGGIVSASHLLPGGELLRASSALEEQRALGSAL